MRAYFCFEQASQAELRGRQPQNLLFFLPLQSKYKGDSEPAPECASSSIICPPSILQSKISGRISKFLVFPLDFIFAYAAFTFEYLLYSRNESVLFFVLFTDDFYLRRFGSSHELWCFFLYLAGVQNLYAFRQHLV